MADEGRDELPGRIDEKVEEIAHQALPAKWHSLITRVEKT
jgi:hypothetical protein